MAADAAAARADRRSQVRDVKRRSILEAAERVLRRDGLGGLTLRAVAQEAGYAPGSVYSYFDNKDALARALAAEALQRLDRRLKAIADPDEAASQAVDALAFEPALAALAARKADPDRGEDRLLAGRLIAVLTRLAPEPGAATRAQQAETVARACLIAGLAALERSGRLEALGFTREEVLEAGLKPHG